MIDANVNKIFHKIVSIFLVQIDYMHMQQQVSPSIGNRCPSIVISTNESTDNYFRKSNLLCEKQFLCFFFERALSDFVVVAPNQSSLTPRFVTTAISIYLFDLFKTTVAILSKPRKQLHETSKTIYKRTATYLCESTKGSSATVSRGYRQPVNSTPVEQQEIPFQI